jgi:hypothetical protein
MLKMLSSRKKEEEETSINNFHSTIAGLESKIEMFQQLFQKLGQNEENTENNDSSQQLIN